MRAEQPFRIVLQHLNLGRRIGTSKINLKPTIVFHFICGCFGIYYSIGASAGLCFVSVSSLICLVEGHSSPAAQVSYGVLQGKKSKRKVQGVPQSQTEVLGPLSVPHLH